MKRLFVLAAAMLMGTAVFAQDPLTKYLEGRFGGPESQTFIAKGSRAIGIKGGFRSFSASGDDLTNAGYSILSLVNIGNGQLKVWNVSPSFSTFLADNLSLGVALHYNGYKVDTDLRLDFRDVISGLEDMDMLNLTVSNRSMWHHAGGASVSIRKYVPLFGSKMIAIFGEGRLQGTYGVTSSAPRDPQDYNRERLSHTFGVALKAGGGVAIKLGENAITVSLPLFGIGYNRTTQTKTTTILERDDDGKVISTNQVQSKAHMSNFSATRNLDWVGVQFGFVRYIKPKKK